MVVVADVGLWVVMDLVVGGVGFFVFAICGGGGFSWWWGWVIDGGGG